MRPLSNPDIHSESAARLVTMMASADDLLRAARGDMRRLRQREDVAAGTPSAHLSLPQAQAVASLKRPVASAFPMRPQAPVRSQSAPPMTADSVHPFEILGDTIAAWLDAIWRGPAPSNVWMQRAALDRSGATWAAMAFHTRARGDFRFEQGRADVYLVPRMRTPRPTKAALEPCIEQWDEHMFEHLLWATARY